MSLLEDLFTKYGTDKGIWGYTPAYEAHLGSMRDTAKRVLEIGICGYRDIPNNVVGASLFAWRDYFPQAEIYGIDNDGKFIFNDQFRIHTALANAYDPISLGSALSKMEVQHGEMFDFICDDAVHDPLPQIELCLSLWPFLKKGGVYSIEDTCPYKCMDNDLDHMIRILLNAGTGPISVYQTHKDERLVLIRKD